MGFFFPMAIYVSLVEGTPNTTRQMKECSAQKGTISNRKSQFPTIDFQGIFVSYLSEMM